MKIVSEDQWAILTIIGEALNQSLTGKIAVAEVIRNRMKRKYASDGTVVGTVLRAKQFSMWDDKARLLAARADDDTYSVREAIEAWNLSENTNITNGAVLYHTKSVDPYWNGAPSVKKTVVIQDHIFYNDTKGA